MPYYDNEGKISIIPSAAKLSDKLPLGTYTVVKDANAPLYYLEKTKDLEGSEGLFGLQLKAERVIKTFLDRKQSTGVLAQGVQGTGKTELVRIISQELFKKNISTILVNDGFKGPEFVQFITEISEECFIVFDEFEKNYSYRDQALLLTLLSGVSNSKKLYMLTANEKNDINKYFNNRPGRIFYSFKMNGLSPEDIRWYVNKHLNNKDHAQGLIEYAEAKVVFTIDMLAAVVEEMNRYNESIDDIKEIINIADMADYACYLGLLLDHGGEIICTASIPLHSTPPQLNNRTLNFRVMVDEMPDHEGKMVKLPEPRDIMENHAIKHSQLVALNRDTKTYIYKSRDNRFIALLQSSLFGSKADDDDFSSRNLITDEQQTEVVNTLKNHPWYNDNQTLVTNVSVELNKETSKKVKQANKETVTTNQIQPVMPQGVLYGVF